MAKISSTREPGRADTSSKWRGGRTPKEESQLHSFYYGFRLDEFQNIEFERLFENSGAKTKSQFILAALFDKPMKVVKIDKAATDYYIKLTNLQSEYRRIGVNYNQAVKALHTGLSEKKALAMLYKLEQLTIEFISLNREIIRLTQEFEQWLQK